MNFEVLLHTFIERAARGGFLWVAKFDGVGRQEAGGSVHDSAVDGGFFGLYFCG